MAITILNPARFNDDGGVGGRQYIRAAFFDEGYGVSTSFFAYRQGGGIVPSTSTFNIIGAGTAGDPLRMSQFSGFVVPSLSLDTQTVTTGGLFFGGGEDATQFSGYELASYGSISDGTFNVKSDAGIVGLYHFISEGSGSGILYFTLGGTHTNAGWTTMTIGASDSYSRTSASFSNYNLGPGQPRTEWSWSTNSGRPFEQGAFISQVFTVTFT